MNKFIVVDVLLDCDRVETVEIRASFNSREDAENYIQQEKDKNQVSWEARRKYTNDYVDGLNTPEDNTVAHFLNTEYNYDYGTYFPCSQQELLENFKKHLSQYPWTLRNLKDFNPPPAYYEGKLFMLEVKDE